MASHSSSSSNPAAPGTPEDLATHRAAYDGFVAFSMGGSIICLYIVVALVVFRFVSNPFNLVLGFGGILVGVIASVLALRMGGKWLMPIILLVLYGVLAAANVHMS